jgi:hypothetical protein
MRSPAGVAEQGLSSSWKFITALAIPVLRKFSWAKQVHGIWSNGRCWNGWGVTELILNRLSRICRVSGRGKKWWHHFASWRVDWVVKWRGEENARCWYRKIRTEWSETFPGDLWSNDGIGIPWVPHREPPLIWPFTQSFRFSENLVILMMFMSLTLATSSIYYRLWSSKSWHDFPAATLLSAIDNSNSLNVWRAQVNLWRIFGKRPDMFESLITIVESVNSVI